MLGTKRYGEMLDEDAMEYGANPAMPEESLAVGNLTAEELGIDYGVDDMEVGLGTKGPDDMHAMEDGSMMMDDEMSMEEPMPMDSNMKEFMADFLQKKQQTREENSLKFQNQARQMSDKVFGTKRAMPSGY